MLVGGTEWQWHKLGLGEGAVPTYAEYSSGEEELVITNDKLLKEHGLLVATQTRWYLDRKFPSPPCRDATKDRPRVRPVPARERRRSNLALGFHAGLKDRRRPDGCPEAIA